MTAATQTSPASRTTGRMTSRLGLLLGRSLASPLRPADYLELLAPLQALRANRGRIEELIDETADARTLVIRPGRGWRAHRAGQFLSIGVDIRGVRHTRCYSISSAPERGDGCFTITVKAVPDGRVSNHLVRRARTGDTIHLGPAEGGFVLPASAPQPLLFVCAGSGITPVMSMLRSLTARGADFDACLLHYSPSSADSIFRTELQSLAAQSQGRLKLFPVATRNAADGGLHGHFTPEQLRQACPDWEARETYACGPAPLLDRLTSFWAEAGHGARLHVERFQPVLAPLNAGAEGGAVHFSRSGRRVQADGGLSLLAVAEAAGLAPAHGCRMGICHGCTAALKAGCVRDLRDGRLHSEPGERVQICVCAAAGDIDIEL